MSATDWMMMNSVVLLLAVLSLLPVAVASGFGGDGWSASISYTNVKM